MNVPVGLFSGLRRFFLRLPILSRVMIGNSVVIVIGAIAGTFLTRQLALVGNLKLILVFSSLGLILSLLVNYWIIRTTLQPLVELRKVVDQVKIGHTDLPVSLIREADPDIAQLVNVIQTMLSRLESHSQQLRALSERAINAQEEERKRIARSLHDDTSQALSMLIIQLERLQTNPPEDSALLRSRLHEVHSLATRILDELRKNIWDLRPTILDDLGLVPAIRWYARTNLEEAHISVQLDIPDPNIRLESHLETLLFRVSQEAINNILRHANAQMAIIGLQQNQNSVILAIEDDGQGFDVNQTTDIAVSQKRLGLLGIQERVSLVGGEVNIHSRPGEGTRLEVHVPLLETPKTRVEITEAMDKEQAGAV